MADVILVENDEGVDITITVEEDGAAVDISTATTKQLKFQYPDGTGVIKDGEFVTDGSDGKLKYSTEAGFLTPAGRWKVQGYFVLPTPSQKWHTSSAEFFVTEALV